MSVQTTEARLESAGQVLGFYAQGGSAPQGRAEVGSAGWPWPMGTREGLTETQLHLFHLEKFLYPQLIPSFYEIP